ncbi:MAG: amidohydrolase family protein [Gemmatales bacterium]|nr:amidohydrolase family protein [Gemmatales bacterium]MDW8387765.1 amidohydrolase family protein [Gemmatales bacterium]
MRCHTFVLPLLLATAGLASADEVLAIKGGKILPVSGPVIEQGVIVLRNGKIEAVGKDVPIPSEAKVLDATGKVVVPGLIEVHSSRGMDQTNETNPIVPFLSVVDAIDPSQDYFEECRRQGITTAAIVPGNNTIFGGQAAIVRTSGQFLNEMLIKRDIGIKISLRPTGDRNRMGQVAAIRRELDAAREAMTERGRTSQAQPQPAPDAKGGTGSPEARNAEPADPPGGGGESAAANDDEDTQQRRPRPGGGDQPGQETNPDAALVRAALARLLKGEQLAFIYCELPMDVPQAIRLVKDYKLRGVLVLGPQCHRAVKQVAASGLPVILEPTLVLWETDPRSGEEKQIVLPKLYREAGVPVTFTVTPTQSAGGGRGGGSQPPMLGTNYLWFQAATAVKYGVPYDEALRAITLRPAEVLGIADSRGSLEPGKAADVVILSGDPLKLDTWVETTIVDGRIVYERANDRKIKALLKPEAE